MTRKPLKDPQLVRNPGEQERLRKEALSYRHLLTHKPANPYCDFCVIGKSRDKKKYKNKFDRELSAFADIITADNVDMNDMGVFDQYHAMKRALVVKDLYTKFKYCFPVVTKHHDEQYLCLADFLGDVKPKLIYSDYAGELRAVAHKHTRSMGRVYSRCPSDQ